MKERIEVNTQTLLSVFNSRGGMPDPEDSGPLGPGGPVMGVAAALVATQVINTATMLQQAGMAMQREDLGNEFQVAAGRMVKQFAVQFCEMPPPRRWPIPWPDPWPWLLGPYPQPWLLGPHPEPWLTGPRPEPWGRELDRLFKEPQGIDLVIAGLQFNNAASLLEDCELKSSMVEAAGKLLETGLNR